MKHLRWMAMLCLLVTLSVVASACARGTTLAPPPSATPSPEPAPPGQTAPSTLPALSALRQSLAFDHLTPEMGLSQSVVSDMVQDEQGFIWFTTQDGLNRYDGEQFRIFKHDPRRPEGISNSFTTWLEKDLHGSLWIGTNAGGLNKYDLLTGRFTHFLNDPEDPNSLAENSVSALHIDRQGRLWIGTPNSGLDVLDMDRGNFTHYQHNPQDPNSLSSNLVSSIWQSADGAIWIGTTGGGLNHLDPTTGTFRRHTADPNTPGSLSSNFVSAIYEDRQGKLWVGTTDNGLNEWLPESGTFRHYASIPEDPTSINDIWVTAIYEDRRGTLWIGTYHGGLNVLDRATGVFTHYRNDPYDPLSLSNDNINSIFEDQSGMMWFGTFGSGVDTYDAYRDKFIHLTSKPGVDQGLLSSSIWAVYEDPQQNLWVGTMGGGLSRVDLQTGAWTHYLSDPLDPTSLNSNFIFSIYQDSQGTLWAGTDIGINRFNPHTETWEPVQLSALVLSMLEDRRGNFWLGTVIGLYRYDRQSGEIEVFVNDPQDPNSPSSNGIGILREDHLGNLWVGTMNGGLNYYDVAAQKFYRYQHDPGNPASLSDNAVISIYLAEDGTMWVGTAGGLNRFNPASGQFRSYREADGLPNDYIYGILEDEQGRLWLSTNRGISRFSPQTLTFKNYDSSDGLQGLEFNQGAYFESQSGVMYFGGVKGLDVFHPSAIQDNPFVPPVVITEFQVHQNPVFVGPDSPLKLPVELSQEIRLPYTDNTFAFGYAALHFASPDEQHYAYILEGYDEAWNEVGSVRVARYTRVTPGNYTFRVKGSNSDGVWNEQGAAIRVIIPPPFWQTTWFRVLAAGAVLGAIVGGFALRTRGLEIQRRRLEVQVAERTHELRETMVALEHSRDAAQAANRAKSTFLANISHEFRTPLNAILGFTQVMVWDKSLAPDHKENLEIIHRSSEHLLGLINDVLEISKIEAGRLTLNPSNFDLHHMLEGLEEMFRLRAEDKGLDLEVVLAPEVPNYIRADEGKLRQVLMNLLGNAVKFTQQGIVQLRVRTHLPGEPLPEPTSHIGFEIEDTGPGIAPNELAQLFTPFVQTNSGRQAGEGTGLGLPISQQYVRLMGGEIQVRSQAGRGSTFQFEIPVAFVTSDELEILPTTQRVVGLESGQPAYRLLVVDDQPANRKLLSKLLAPVGFEVREAANGQEALEAWEAWSPQLIWMDMRMPVMDGYEATRRIKATSRGQATVIIALTASGLEEDRAVILSEGCDDYIRKPFHEKELFDALARHLGARFVYEQIEPAKLGEAPGVPPAGEKAAVGQWVARDLAARMRQMDADWRSRLERATVLGEQQIILDLVNEIVEIEPHLAAGIANLAERFDHDRILAILEDAARGETHANK